MTTLSGHARALLATLILAVPDSHLSVAAQSIPREPEAYRPDEIRIGLQRTVCFGTCPVYTLTILGDGTVNYFGSQFVGVEGSREDKVGPDQVAALVNEFLRCRIFDMADSYDGGEKVEFRDGRYLRLSSEATDLPSTILSIELGGRKKRVLLRYQYPAELGRVANLIDDVTQSKRWTARQ